jgi:hypothetical protein
MARGANKQDGDYLEDSPASEKSHGASSADDVKSEGSGDQRAVPYHRLQKEVWKRQELEQEMETMRSDMEELRHQRPLPKEVEAEAPDQEEDPVGHAQFVADQARRDSRKAQERIEQLEQEQHRFSTLNDMRREFDQSINKFPGLQNEEYVEFAWEQFCMGKERSRGRATGEEILKGVDSIMRGYGDSGKGNPKREALKGKPKTPERTETTVPAGERAPLTRKMSFREKMDKRLLKARENALAQLEASARKTSGM